MQPSRAAGGIDRTERSKQCCETINRRQKATEGPIRVGPIGCPEGFPDAIAWLSKGMLEYLLNMNERPFIRGDDLLIPFVQTAERNYEHVGDTGKDSGNAEFRRCVCALHE